MLYREYQGEKCHVGRRMNFLVALAQKFVRRHVVGLHQPAIIHF